MHGFQIAIVFFYYRNKNIINENFFMQCCKNKQSKHRKIGLENQPKLKKKLFRAKRLINKGCPGNMNHRIIFMHLIVYWTITRGAMAKHINKMEKYLNISKEEHIIFWQVIKFKCFKNAFWLVLGWHKKFR